MADSLSPGEVIERYSVVRRIGSGGMAEVYLVEHVTLRTVHALKVLTLSGPTLDERMVEEGRIQARLRHPNVVHVSDVLFVRGMPALVMELVDGPDLKRWIADTRPDPERAVQVFRGIVAGVSAAHAAGVIHRDLKPANVLLATIGGELVPKVGDFGLVKVIRGDERGHTRTGIPMGTPQYMAPEQIRDAARVDQRADIFSLGCILYELLTWEQAHGGTDLISIFEKIDRGRRAPLPPGVPGHLRRLIDRCLAREPDDRPPDCATILAALDGGSLSPPRPPPRAPSRAWRPLLLPWLAALAVVSGGTSVLMISLALVVRAWAPAPEAEPPLCPTSGGRLGFAAAPAGFDKKVGAIWTLRAETRVFEGIEGSEPRAICRMPPGAQVTLIEAPVAVGSTRWVAVDAERIGAGLTGVEEEPEPPEEEEDSDRCHGPAGKRIGWFHTRANGLVTPGKGKTWRVSSERPVLADYPRRENGGRAGPQVCALPAGAEIRIVEEVVRLGVGKGYWVPLTGTDPLD